MSVLTRDGVLLPASDPIPPPRFASRWLDKNRLQVDDLDEGQRQIWKRNDDGFRLASSEPLP